MRTDEWDQHQQDEWDIYNSNGHARQGHTYGLNLYLPCSGTFSNEPAIYDFRSALGAGINIHWNPYASDFPAPQAKNLIAEFKRLRPFFYGDFYPLTGHSISDYVWMAYQFHREDLGQGMFLAFRRPNSPDLTARLKLSGLLPSARYELNFEDTGKKQTFTGEALAAGIDVTIKHAPGSLLVTYHECH
jgi:alpha-galactosidase